MVSRVSVGAVLAVCIGVAATAWAGEQQPLRVLKQYKVGGEGGWDYLVVDQQSRRLYVTRQTHVMVLDADSGDVVGDMTDTPGVHGVALAPEFGRGFISDGRANTATIFDLKTLKPISTVKVGENPDAILFDPYTKLVFTFNGRSHDATAFDAQTGELKSTIPLEGKPEFAVSDGKGQIFVNIEDKSEVVRIDPKELKVTARWPLAPGEGPSGLALDAKNRRLFSVCDNKTMVVLDADSGNVLTTLPIGEHVDAAAFDPETSEAFSSNGDGTLTVVHEDDPAKFTVSQTVTTQQGARTMALDPKTHNIYLATAEFVIPAQDSRAARRRPTAMPNSFTILVVGR